VFVRVPVSSGSASEAEMGRAEELISWANDHDVGVVDLSGLPVENRHFRDGKHLNKRGRALFTDALAEALDGLGVFGQGPLEEARIPLAAPTISRAAAPPMLAPVQPSDLEPMEGCVRSVQRADLAPYGAGSLARKRLWNASPLRYRLDGELQELKPGRIVKSTCSGVALNGDRLLVAGMSGPIELVLAPGAPLSLEGKRNVHWVYPDSPLLVTLGEERRAALEEAGGPFAFDVVVQPLRQGAAPVVVSFDDGPPEALATRRGRLVESAFEVGGLPERLSVASDEPAVVRLIRIRAPSETEVLVGELDRAGESVVRMFEGGKTPTRFGRPPPSLDSAAPTRAGDEWVWRVPHLKHINNSAVFRASDKYNCSPVRVVHGGDVQAFSYASCNAMKPGTICFDGPAVRIRPVQPIDASGFRLGLDSSRQCRTWTFLYGGDSLTHELDDAALSRLLAGVEQLELMAEVLPSASATLKDEHWTVSLHSSKGRLVKRRLAVRDFAVSIQRFRLNKGRGQDGLKLVIEADEGAPPIIVGYALLHERVRPRVVPSTDDIQSLKQRIQQVRLKRKPASDESGGGAP
ncbi:MAG: hypothetical protein VX944_13900, partial [Myxococcota bacterium]|nr:hypothetical protein [Myxococcota bacterium]